MFRKAPCKVGVDSKSCFIEQLNCRLCGEKEMGTDYYKVFPSMSGKSTGYWRRCPKVGVKTRRRRRSPLGRGVLFWRASDLAPGVVEAHPEHAHEQVDGVAREVSFRPPLIIYGREIPSTIFSKAFPV